MGLIETFRISPSTHNLHSNTASYLNCRGCAPRGPVSCSRPGCKGFLHREYHSDDAGVRLLAEACDSCGQGLWWLDSRDQLELERLWNEAGLTIVDEFEP